MKNIIIFDDPATHMNLLPITYTRPISYIRVGITTIYEKWQYFIKDAEFSSLVDPYLMKKYPTTITDENYFIAGHIYPCDALVEAIFKLDKGTALLSPSEQLIAFRGTMEDFDKKKFTSTTTYHEEPKQLHWLYDIFLHNDEHASRQDASRNRSAPPTGSSATMSLTTAHQNTSSRRAQA